MITQNSYKIKIVSLLTLLVFISIMIKSIFFDKLTVFAILIALLLFGKKEKSYLNPYYIFITTPFSLLIYFNVVDLYLVELTHNTYLLAIINMMAFIVGLSLKPILKIKKIYHKNFDSKLSVIFKIFILLALSLMGIILPFLDSVTSLFIIPAIVFAFKSKEKKLIMAIVVFILLKSFDGITKTDILFYVFSFIICYHKYYTTYTKQIFRNIIILGLSSIFMIQSFSFANKDEAVNDADQNLEYFGRQGHDWKLDATYFLPYMYFVTPWTNLQYVVEKQDKRTYGLWCLKPFINYLQIDYIFNEKYELISYSNFNTFTFISVLFKDFGYWLSTVPSLILGLLVKKVYCRFLVSKSPFDIASYIVISIATFQMYFSNHFFMLSYPITMLLLMRLTKFFIHNYKK